MPKLTFSFHCLKWDGVTQNTRVVLDPDQWQWHSGAVGGSTASTLSWRPQPREFLRLQTPLYVWFCWTEFLEGQTKIYCEEKAFISCHSFLPLPLKFLAAPPNTPIALSFVFWKQLFVLPDNLEMEICQCPKSRLKQIELYINIFPICSISILWLIIRDNV